MVEVDEADARVLRVVHSSGRFRNGGKRKRKGKNRAAFFDTCRNSNSRGPPRFRLAQNQTQNPQMPMNDARFAREGEGRFWEFESIRVRVSTLGLGLG